MMALDKRMYTRPFEQVLSYVKVLPSLQVLSKYIDNFIGDTDVMVMESV